MPVKKMKRFEMTPKQREYLLDACRPVPYLIVNGCPPVSSQERANHAWLVLGEELGFDHMTVKPIPGQPDTVFEAEPK